MSYQEELKKVIEEYHSAKEVFERLHNKKYEGIYNQEEYEKARAKAYEMAQKAYDIGKKAYDEGYYMHKQEFQEVLSALKSELDYYNNRNKK